MRILVVGGCGAMGSAIVRDLVESPEVSEVMIGDINIEKARQFAEKLGSPKLSAKRIDVRDHEDLVKNLKGMDAVIAAIWYEYNLYVTKAAIEAKVDYLDLGGLYYMTLKQLELDDLAKKAGITAVLGIGAAPGLSNIMAKYGADKLDQIREVHMKAALKEGVFYTIRTILDEFTKKPIVYQDGKHIEVPPFAGKERTSFPEPIGEVECYYVLHSELATLQHTLDKGVKSVDFKFAFEPAMMSIFQLLMDLGLTRTEPIKVKGIEMSPHDFLAECLSQRYVPEDKTSVDGIRVELIGEKNGENVRYTIETIVKPYERYGIGGGTYMTIVPASTVARMLARGDIKVKGTVPPEICIEPKQFLAELSRRGFKFHEKMEKYRTLFEQRTIFSTTLSSESF